MSKTVAKVKVIFSENRNSILLATGYICAVAAAFLPMFIR